MRMAAIIAAAGLVSVAGCGGQESTAGDRTASTAAEAKGTAGRERPAPEPPRPAPEPLRRARCPAGAANCRSAEGTIIYLERVDPDGDGDAHFVLLSEKSVTGPGLSVIDVEKALRPHPLPGVGDRVSAAGPVYRGSYGQRQIQATEVFTAEG
jgi:hypothetical protein